MSERLLTIDRVSRHFGGVHALSDVSLDVVAGEVHALIGPNGAGKTTLIHQISGAQTPNAGTIHFAGTDITRLSMHERVAIGVARSWQITNVFGRLSALDNVALAVQGRQRDWGSSFRFWAAVDAERAIVDEAASWLAEVGLAGRESQLAGSLAHGEQRQLELALALATKPSLLLLDEPMAGMGPEESERVVNLIEHLGRSVSILLIEHDMDAVFRLADRISVLVGGCLVFTGAPDEVRAHPEVRRAYLGEVSAS
jgi:branched-chain amino acid transport system ATP-binding protein